MFTRDSGWKTVFLNGEWERSGVLVMIIILCVETGGQSRQKGYLFVSSTSLHVIIIIIEYHAVKKLLIIAEYRISKKANRQQAIMLPRGRYDEFASLVLIKRLRQANASATYVLGKDIEFWEGYLS